MPQPRILLTLVFCCFLIACQAQRELAGYQVQENFLKLPESMNLGEVTAVAVNSKGHVFVFNRGPEPLLEFDAQGNYLRTHLKGHTQSPHGLRIDAQDNIWVTDTGTHTVLKLNPQGKVIMVLGKNLAAGEWSDPMGIPLFNKPADVAIAVNGDILVADGYGNSRIVKFDRNGNFLKTWGTKGKGPGVFDLPHAVVIDAQGIVYVADRENHRIQLFDLEGKYLREWKEVGQPFGLALTKNQQLLVSDAKNDRLLLFDLKGKLLGTLGKRGKQTGELGVAHSVAVDAQENIYVAEILNWRMQKFKK